MRSIGFWLALLASFASARTTVAQENQDDEAIARQHLDKGQQAISEGDSARAIDELQASLAAKPTAKAYLLLGNAYTKVGDLDDAKVAYEKFLQLDPKNSKAPTVKRILDEMAVATKTKLRIASNPPGATVYIDLKAEGARGRTPITLAVDPGQHRVFLDAEGFEPVVQAVDAPDGKVTPVTVNLQPKGCDFAISSTPPGATVRVDDGAPHPTPATIRVPLGPHTIEWSGEGLAPKKKQAECKNYTSQAISEFLEKMPNGWLSMNVSEGTKVTVDGKEVPHANLARLELPPGDHAVDVTAPGKAPWHVTTKVRAGMETDLAPRLDVGGLTTGGGTTGIEVVADTSATVRLDGKNIKPMEPLATTPGAHTLEVEMAGSKPYRHTVTIRPGAIAVVNPVLEKPSNFPLYAAGLFVAAGVATAGIAYWGGANNEVMDVEKGGYIATACLGAATIAAVTYWLIDRRSASREKPHVTAAIAPGGASIGVAGAF